jgi:hypothetical protein
MRSLWLSRDLRLCMLGSQRDSGEGQMNVYRLDPIDPDHPSWQNSTEQEGLWAGASTPTDARELVADKARVGAHVADATSPWQDVRVKSCVLEPSVTHIRTGTVVRADGSLVGD